MMAKLKYLVPLVISLIIIFTILPGCGEEAPAQPAAPVKNKIVIGMSRPLSGPLAIIGDSAFRPIYDTIVPLWNKDGGIFIKDLNKKLPIELKIYDDKSDVATMTRNTEKLILEDKVDFLWPACGTSFLFAQAPIANKYNYILVTTEGGASSLKDMLPSMPYVFVSLSFSDWYQIPVLADLLAEKGVKSAYVSYIADLHGVEYSGVAGIEFGKKGITVLGNKSLPPDIKDLSPVIKEAKASNADAFMAFAYPDQVMPAVGTSIELAYNPKVWLGGPGVNFGFFYDAFGPATEGILGFTSFHPSQSQVLKEFADLLYAGKPFAAKDWWGHPLYWGAYQFWKQAIEQAGTLDQKKIRDVMASSRFQTILGETYFVNGLMAKESHPGEIGQWKAGDFHVVGPKEKASSPFVYPKPNWPAPPPK